MTNKCSPLCPPDSQDNSFISFSSSSPSITPVDITPSFRLLPLSSSSSSSSHNEVNYHDNLAAINPYEDASILDARLTSLDSMTEDEQTLVILTTMMMSSRHVHQHPQIRHHEHSLKWNNSNRMMTPMMMLSPSFSTSLESNLNSERKAENNSHSSTHSRQESHQNNSHESKQESVDASKLDQEKSGMESQITPGVLHVLTTLVDSSLQNFSSSSSPSHLDEKKTSTRMVVVTETKLTCYASLTTVTYSTPQEVVILTKTVTVQVTSLVTLHEASSSFPGESQASRESSSSLFTSTSHEVTDIPSLESSISLSHPEENISSSSFSPSSVSVEGTSISLTSSSSSSVSSVTPTINLSHPGEDPSLDHDKQGEHDDQDEDHHQQVLHTTLMPSLTQTSFSLSFPDLSSHDSSSSLSLTTPTIITTTPLTSISLSSETTTPFLHITPSTKSFTHLTPFLTSNDILTDNRTRDSGRNDSSSSIVVTKTLSAEKDTRDDVIPSSTVSTQESSSSSIDFASEDEGEDNHEENKSSLQVSSQEPEAATNTTSKTVLSSSMTLSFEDLITELKESVTPTQSDDFRSRTTLNPDASFPNTLSSIITTSLSQVSTFNNESSSSSSSTSSSETRMTTIKSINQNEEKQRPSPSSSAVNGSTDAVVLQTGVIKTSESTVRITVAPTSSLSIDHENKTMTPLTRIAGSPTPSPGMTINFPEEEEDEGEDESLSSLTKSETLSTPPSRVVPSSTTISSTLSSETSSLPNATTFKTTESPDDIANSFWKSLLPETVMTTTTRDGKTFEGDLSLQPTPPLPTSRTLLPTSSSVNSSQTTYFTPSLPTAVKINLDSTKVNSKSSSKEGGEYGKEDPTLVSASKKILSQSDNEHIHPSLASSLNQTIGQEVTFTLHPLGNEESKEDEEESMKSLTNSDTPSSPHLNPPTNRTSLITSPTFQTTSKVSILPSFSPTPSFSTDDYSISSPSLKKTTKESSSPATPTVSSNKNHNCTQSFLVPSPPSSTLLPTTAFPSLPADNKSNGNKSTKPIDDPFLSFTSPTGQVISLDWLPFLLISIAFVLILLSWVFGFIVCRKNRRLRRQLASSLTSELMSTKIHMPGPPPITSLGSSLSSSNWRMVSTPALLHHPMVMTPVTGTSSTSYTTTSSSIQSIPTLEGNTKSKKKRSKDKSEFEYVSFCHHPIQHRLPLSEEQSSVQSLGHPNLEHHHPFSSRVLTTMKIELDGRTPSSSSSHDVNRSVESLIVMPDTPVPKMRTSLQVQRFSSSHMENESGRHALNDSQNDLNESLESRRVVEDLQRFFEEQVQDQSKGKRGNKKKQSKNKKSINKTMTSQGQEDHQIQEEPGQQELQRRLEEKSSFEDVEEKVVPFSSTLQDFQEDHDYQDHQQESRQQQVYSPLQSMSSYISSNMIDRSSQDPEQEGYRDLQTTGKDDVVHHKRSDQHMRDRSHYSQVPRDLTPSTKAVVEEVRRELHKFDSVVTRNIRPE